MTTGPAATRVLLVDDHAMMRAGFSMILGAQPDLEVVGEAGTGLEALERARELRPDVVCMDVQMPDMDGIEAARRLTAMPDGAARVLIVTTFDDDDYVFAALQAGASGFVLKNAGPEQLVDAVRVLAAGEAVLAPEVTGRVIARFARGSEATAAAAATTAQPAPAAPPVPREHAHPAPGDPDLTDRERDVLALMAEARSNAEIAAALFIGEATVKTHVSNVLHKLGARDRVQAIVLAYQRGLA